MCQKAIYDQLERDDPWITIIPWPCGPWSSWSRFNLGKEGRSMDTVLEKRQEAEALLQFSADVARHRILRGRMVLLENPWSSDAWEHAAMEEILVDPTIEFVRGDFCQWGKRDSESQKLIQKATGFAVTG